MVMSGTCSSMAAVVHRPIKLQLAGGLQAVCLGENKAPLNPTVQTALCRSQVCASAAAWPHPCEDSRVT